KARAGISLEKHAGDMQCAARSRRSQRCLAGIRLQPSDQFLQVACRHRLLCDDQKRFAHQRRNGFEILQHIVIDGEDGAVQDMRGPATKTECVTIAWCTGRSANTDDSRRAGYVLDDHGLTKKGPHTLRHDAPDRIRGTARTIRYNHCNWRDGYPWAVAGGASPIGMAKTRRAIAA